MDRALARVIAEDRDASRDNDSTIRGVKLLQLVLLDVAICGPGEVDREVLDGIARSVDDAVSTTEEDDLIGGIVPSFQIVLDVQFRELNDSAVDCDKWDGLPVILQRVSRVWILGTDEDSVSATTPEER